jgi:glucokinase
MARTVGVVITDRAAVSLVEDNQLAGSIVRFPEDNDAFQILRTMPAEELSSSIQQRILDAAGAKPVDAIGVGVPGIVRGGVVEESPNIQQIKGFNFQQSLRDGLRSRGIDVPVAVSNDADVVAAGLAATRGHLDRLIRVWTLGNGIGFGRYPSGEGIWEGGHSVVTLDPRETYCGCGGVGHLEGIMGHRAMRLRFLDMEPDEVFAEAKGGDARCVDFVKLWHRALAAATATSVHLDGPGKFYLTGPSARYVDLPLLGAYAVEMVKMSPLQGYSFEVVAGGEEVALIGAAVHASQAAFG